MTKQQIKDKKIYLKSIINAKDILLRYGVKVINGRCRGFCHNGKDLNVKIFRDGTQCFKCGRGMDIFQIVQHFENCGFWTAFQILGGTDNIDDETKKKIRSAALKREEELQKEYRRKNNIKKINAQISEYKNLLNYCKPLSEEWAWCYKKWQYWMYLYDYFTGIIC